VKVTHVNLRNFLSFGDEATEVDLGDFNVIVGPNGAGKTNLLRALTFVSRVLSSRGASPFSEYYHADTTEFNLEVGIVMTDEERYALADYLVCSPLVESVPVGQNESQPAVQRNAFDTAATLRNVFASAFANVDLVVHGSGSETETPEVNLRFVAGGRQFFIGRQGSIRITDAPFMGGNVLQFARFVLDALQNADPRQDLSAQFFPQLQAALENRYPAIQLASWIALNDLERRSPAREYARRLKAFLRKRGFFQDSADAFSIVLAIYEAAVIPLSEMRVRTGGFVALPAAPDARGVAPEGREEDMGLTLFRLKNSLHTEERERYDSIKKAFKLFFNQSFDFEVVLRDRLESPSGAQPPAEGAKVAHEVAVFVRDQRAWVHLDFSPAGVFEILFLLTKVIGSKDKTLLLDEPALNLHPTKQVELRRVLEEIAHSSNQVIMTTHSPVLVSSRWLEHTLRFQIRDAQTRVQRLATADSDTLPRMIKEFERNTKAVSILFATKVILVEGDDEEAALPVWFEKCNPRIDIEYNNWVLLNVRGDQSFKGFATIVEAWGIPYWIVCDKKAIPLVIGLEDRTSMLEEDDFLDLIKKEREQAYEEAVKALGRGYEGKNPTVMRIVAQKTNPPPEIERIAKEISMGFSEK